MTVQTSNPDRKVPTRRISFEESLQQVPKHFAADGDLIQSHLAASLSAVFPDGEDFFVRSVRNFRDQINDRLAELGYPSKQVERFTKKGLAIRERFLSPKSNLAATAALEHFTATLAEMLLTDEDARAMFGNEEVKNLFVWHALEESEHKSVAFDVYKAVGGGERLRVFTMNALTVGFIGGMVFQVGISLLFDRATYRRGNLRKSWRRFRRSPIMRRELWQQLRDYNRPDFHPDDRDTTALVEEWRNRLFGSAGTLNDKLASAAA
jgi:predicted metal-dependent hydrolase